MDDTTTTVAELKTAVAAFRDARDWAQFHTAKDLALSIAIEAAELMELFQWKTNAEAVAFLAEDAGAARLREEFADVLIYCLSLADALGVDVSRAVHDKLEKNGARYPAGLSRGTATKYTDLTGPLSPG